MHRIVPILALALLVGCASFHTKPDGSAVGNAIGKGSVTTEVVTPDGNTVTSTATSEGFSEGFVGAITSVVAQARDAFLAFMGRDAEPQPIVVNVPPQPAPEPPPAD